MKRAFSLIELSIVILIIGVLTAAVGQGIDLLQDARLSAARMLTQSSRVNALKGLILWLDTTSEASFSSSEAADGSTVSSWNDINPQTTAKNNATQSGGASLKPTYTEKGFNNLPVLRFDGAADFLDYDGSGLINSSYTIFVVEQKSTVGSNTYGFFIGGTNAQTAGLLELGYHTPAQNSIADNHWGSSNMGYTPPTGYTLTPSMHSFWFSTSGGKKYWLNGGLTPEANDVAQTTALASYTGARIGNSTVGYYKGDIAEIIMFGRALSDKDRQAVESYLSKKWAIKTS